MCQYLIVTQYCHSFKEVKWKFKQTFLLQCAVFLSRTTYFGGNDIKWVLSILVWLSCANKAVTFSHELVLRCEGQLTSCNTAGTCNALHKYSPTFHGLYWDFSHLEYTRYPKKKKWYWNTKQLFLLLAWVNIWLRYPFCTAGSWHFLPVLLEKIAQALWDRIENIGKLQISSLGTDSRLC